VLFANTDTDSLGFDKVDLPIECVQFKNAIRGFSGVAFAIERKAPTKYVQVMSECARCVLLATLNF